MSLVNRYSNTTPVTKLLGTGLWAGLSRKIGALAAFGLVLAGCASPSVFNSNWVLEELSGADISGQTIMFAADGTASGSMGCNAYNLPARLTDDQVEFFEGEQTLLSCPDQEMMQAGRAYMSALAGKFRVLRPARDELVLIGENNRTFRFRRLRSARND